MNLKPSDLFIGLMEFFSIFLPGFISIFLFRKPLLQGFSLDEKEATSTKIAFYFVTSYIAGHFIYALGSLIFEKMLEFNKKDILFCDTKEKNMIKRAEEIMVDKSRLTAAEKKIGDETSFEIQVNLKFKMWANSIIQIKHLDSLVGVRQNEADSKFFRSFIIVSLLGLFVSLGNPKSQLPWYFWTFALIFSVCLHFFRRVKVKCELANIIILMYKLGELDNNLAASK